MNRRRFLQTTAGAAAFFAARRRAYALFSQSPTLWKFQNPTSTVPWELPDLTKSLAEPTSDTQLSSQNGYDFYELIMKDFSANLHPALGDTRLYGYGYKRNGGFSWSHLGGSIVAKKGRPVRLRAKNMLPTSHILPVDPTLVSEDWSGDSGVLQHDRAAVHLHGGHVPWPSDGGPLSWFTSTGLASPWHPGSWLPEKDGSFTTESSYDYWYPNTESARMMWFHDHALGITRLNAYAGLAAGYIVTDENDEKNVRDFCDRRVPLVFQDKIFTTSGDLWYPSQYDTQFFALAPGTLPTGLPPTSVNTEFWGDTILSNGVAYPTMRVKPRRYRFQILNACNTRFLRLRLLYANGQSFPDNAEANERDPGPPLQVIGNECGFLNPALTGPSGALFTNKGGGLLLSPAERSEVIIDFSKVKPGKFLILYNDAPVPFPAGTPLADFHSGNSKLPFGPPMPGYGPNTRTLLRFFVEEAGLEPADSAAPLVLPSYPTDPDDPRTPLWDYAKNAPTLRAGTPKTIDVTLNEAFDKYGRLMPVLGSSTPNQDLALGFGRKYKEDPTETAIAGDVQIWRIFNLTADTHPIHFHLVNVQIVSRQTFNVGQYNGFAPNFTSKPTLPAPEEMGWKETVRVNPGECMTVIMKLDLPPAPARVPTSGHFGGHEYVWHCHILEHEDHDMMRPLVVNERTTI